jgi:proteasome assembly chaperone (PAC2) family protein
VADFHERHPEAPTPRAPVLLVCLDGWVDAGGAAQAVVEHLRQRDDQHVVATFDADRLLDHRARRPIMRLEDGVITSMSWPGTELLLLRDDNGRDVLLLHGAEPDHEWYGFIAETLELCADLGVTMVVGLGAYPAPTPHTRPTRLACTAATAELAARLPFERATLELPAGIQAAIEHEVALDGLPAIGLWAQVPHYASAMAYPPASVALLDALAQLTGLAFHQGELREAAAVSVARIDGLIERESEHALMVSQLEALYDRQIEATAAELPSGEELAAELERFLRGEGDGT